LYRGGFVTTSSALMIDRSKIVVLGRAGDPNGLSEAERFAMLVDALRDYAIYLLNPEGIVATWNTGAQRLKGYRPSEIIGQPFSRFFTPEDQKAGLPDRILRECRATGRVEAEGWRVRKDGSRFRANAIINAVHDAEGNLIGFAKITRDVTERIAAQQALIDSERRFRLLVQSIVDYAIYMLDPSGIITNWNSGAERLKGYNAGEIVGQHFSRFYTKEDRAAGLPSRVLDTARREGRFESEGWRVRKDGSRFWASVVVDAIRDESGELLGFAKITRDITERVAAQQALRDSERQLRLFIRGVVDYALYMIDPNGIVTSWNLGAERIKGYTSDEIIGQHFSKFYTEAERAEGAPAKALFTAVREGRYEAEGWRVRKDGSLFWAHVIVDPIRDEDGKLTGFAKITRDITDKREAQLALEQAQAQRAQTQKMEALGQLTGGVAHDFNNLLMVVSGYIQTLKAIVAENPKGARAANAIELAAQRGQALTRQLLSFARRQPLNPITVSLTKRLEALRPMLMTSVGTTARIAIAVAADAWPIRVDANEFDLALLNLTLNARDAMTDNGVITIAVENARLEGANAPRGLSGDFVAITVADTGHGMPPDIVDKVFHPFFTTKPQGNGLGLSQVHGLAHQSGGTVTIDSELGRGTRVTLYFPRAHETADAAGEDLPLPGNGKGTVLLVEDNPDVAGATTALVEQLGFQVRTSNNARAALDLIGRHDFALVITDIVMAGEMDGLGLARSVREHHPELPLILVTGYSEAASGADKDFVMLRKPYQLADLGRAVGKVMGAHKPASNLVRLRDGKAPRG
jgi:PAS domain S-box-containing protein